MSPLVFLFAAVIALAAGPAEGAAAAGGPQKKKEPIHVTSNRMEAFNKRNLIVFIGKVKAVQGDLTIQSDRLEVYVKKKEKDADATTDASPATKRGASTKGAEGDRQGGQVERIVAIGNVLINQSKTKFASGQRLDYNEGTGVGVLTGNPRAWEGQNQVIGEKIELFLKEDRTVVHGTVNRRVNVTLFPNDQKPGGSVRPPQKGSNAPAKR